MLFLRSSLSFITNTLLFISGRLFRRVMCRTRQGKTEREDARKNITYASHSVSRAAESLNLSIFNSAQTSRRQCEE